MEEKKFKMEDLKQKLSERLSTNTSNSNIKKDSINTNNNKVDLSKNKKSKVQLVSKKTFSKDYFGDEENENNKNFKNKKIESKIIEEKNENDDNYIQKKYNEFLGRDSTIKRTNSMPDLSTNQTLEEKKKINLIPSLAKDKKKKINELNNLNGIVGLGLSGIKEENENEMEDRLSIINIDNNIKMNTTYMNVNNINENMKLDEDDNYDKQQRINLRSKSFFKEKEMTQKFYELNDQKNIIFNNTTNDIERIHSNLLLKKIIFEDFLQKYADNIYHFCQQCFCFIKIDVFFTKILNCYKHYRKKNIPVEKISNLVEFLNILIIEMIEYYKMIPKDEFNLLKDIYYYIISDLIINNNKSNKNDNNNDFEIIYEKSDFINDDLALDENEFGENLKLNENINNDTNNEKKETEESIFFDKDYIVIEKDKDSFDENIYNEDKEFDNFLYTTFLQDIFGAAKNGQIDNIENISVISPTEKLLNDIHQFMIIFKSKKPAYDIIIEVKNNISFYNNLKENELQSNSRNNIDIKLTKSLQSKNLTRRASCMLNYDKIQRKYMQKGFFCILDWKVEEIGDELMYVTKKLLKKIERKELYKAIYLKKDKETKCPNVIENINNFNKLTFFIIEDIISYDHASDRAKIIDKWLQVAEYCKTQKDYNDCIAINSALNSYIITGLSLTNKELKYRTNTLIKNIGTFCSCNGNYKYIREEINNLINKNDYFYPYLGMMLRDITFLEETSKYLIDGEFINFKKIENVQNVLENNFRFKNHENKVEDKNKFIQELKFFEDLEMNTEENLESIANQVEPKFMFNEGKKEFKRTTNIDEKYFKKYINPLYFGKSSTLQVNYLTLG